MPITQTRSLKRTVLQIFGYTIAIACLVWVFHDFKFGQFLRHMSKISWGWIVVAMVSDVLGYVCQGLRWQLLLRPLGPLPVSKAVQAVYIALFTNEILPLRVGELVRMYLVSRWLSTRFVAIVPSAVVERLFDGIWLALAVGVVAWLVPLPTNILSAEEIFAVLMLGSTVVFIFLIFRKKKSQGKGIANCKWSWRPVRYVTSLIARLAEGVHDIGMTRFTYSSLIASLFILVFQMFSMWFVMKGYGLALSFWVGAAVLIIVHFGTFIPNAPSNIGTYQFFAVVALSVFGIEKNVAAGFSLVAFFVMTFPLFVIGLLALMRSGLSLSEIRNKVKTLRSDDTGNKKHKADAVEN